MRRRTTIPKPGGSAGETNTPFLPPYPPSWVDRLTDAVDRLPGPAWLAFVGLAAVGVLVQLGIQASTADYSPERHLPMHIWVAGNFAYLLGVIHYLDRSAAAALEVFRPVLQLTPPQGSTESHETLDELRYRLTTMPARTTAWVTVLGGLTLVLLTTLLIRGPAGGPAGVAVNPMRSLAAVGLSASPAAFAAYLLQFAGSQVIAAVALYHTIYQLRLIHNIYVKHTRVHLYRLQPLYAFSVLAALTAGSLLLYSYLWVATAPEFFNEAASIGVVALTTGLAVVTFTWPLWGIHRRLVEEKKRLLQESSMRFEVSVAQLHQRVDRGRLTRMDDLNKTLASLEIEQAALRRVPTWPWEPGTVRALVAALLVPIIIWLTQNILQRLLG